MTSRPGLRVLLAALVTSVLTGCVSMPVDGPVVTAGEDSGIRNDDPADIVVQPPTPGESPTDIVVHFLDAMTASPLSTSVARKYLTEAGAEAWQPEREIITYADKSRPDSGTQPDPGLPRRRQPPRRPRGRVASGGPCPARAASCGSRSS